MRSLKIFKAALILLLLVFSTSAKTEQPNNSEVFLKAQAAYDAGDFAEASMHYEELLRNTTNIEVSYNLANAYFKMGNLPEAVLHYRTAWYSTPRDPDIRANLDFALHAAGAIAPSSSLIEKTLSTLSHNEWIQVAIGAYVIFTLLLILGMLIRPAKRILIKISLLPALLILVAVGGWWHWQQFKNTPEAVVIKSDTIALFGPIEGSTAHYKIPLAALIRQRSADSNGWIEVEYDGKNGWVKAAYIHRVSP